MQNMWPQGKGSGLSLDYLCKYLSFVILGDADSNHIPFESNAPATSTAVAGLSGDVAEIVGLFGQLMERADRGAGGTGQSEDDPMAHLLVALRRHGFNTEEGRAAAVQRLCDVS